MFCDDFTGSSKLVHKFFLMLNHKMPKSKYLRHKKSYDIIYVKYGPKNAQILEFGSGKPQNWETSRYLSNFKFLGVIYDKI